MKQKQKTTKEQKNNNKNKTKGSNKNNKTTKQQNNKTTKQQQSKQTKKIPNTKQQKTTKRPNGVRFIAAAGTAEFARRWNPQEGSIVSFKHSGYLLSSKKPKLPSLY